MASGHDHTGHGHGGHDHAHDHRSASSGRLLAAFLLLAGFAVLEVVSGFMLGSLALLSDAGHMVTDVVGIGIALVAARLAAAGKPDERRTFGLFRLEILGALANAVLLSGMAAYIVYSAVRRIGGEPEHLETGTLAIVAALGLLANIGAFFILRSGAKTNLNTEAAYLEVLADLFGSVGVLIGAGVMQLTGWTWVDPLVGIGIALFIVPRTIRLALQALHILLEGAPRGVDVAAMRQGLLAIPGVGEVHDLHVWTVASGMELCSVHVRATPGADLHSLLDQAEAFLRTEHHIDHVTLQLEPDDHDGCRVAESPW